MDKDLGLPVAGSAVEDLSEISPDAIGYDFLELSDFLLPPSTSTQNREIDKYRRQNPRPLWCPATPDLSFLTPSPRFPGRNFGQRENCRHEAEVCIGLSEWNRKVF